MFATASATANVLVVKHGAMRRRICVALEFIAHRKTDTELTEQNKQAMALTHGFAHGVVQSVVFIIRYAAKHRSYCAPHLLDVLHGCKSR